jgi:hypothetical protein
VRDSAPKTTWHGNFRKYTRFLTIPAKIGLHNNKQNREEEDPDEYPFPLTLRTKRSSIGSPLDGVLFNGDGAPSG